MTPTTLAAALLKDVPRYDTDPKDRRDFVATPDGGWLNLDEVLAALTAALSARGMGVPEGWHMERLSRGNGFLFYTLRQDGWRKGEPIMVNDVTIRLEPTPGSDTDLEPIASAILAALAPTDAAQARAPFFFDRYINGLRMAEGVCIERETTLEGAMQAAARIAAKGPNGEPPVLVYRTTDAAQAREVALKEAAALLESMSRTVTHTDEVLGAQTAHSLVDPRKAAARILALLSEART